MPEEERRRQLKRELESGYHSLSWTIGTLITHAPFVASLRCCPRRLRRFRQRHMHEQCDDQLPQYIANVTVNEWVRHVQRVNENMLENITAPYGVLAIGPRGARRVEVPWASASPRGVSGLRARPVYDVMFRGRLTKEHMNKPERPKLTSIPIGQAMVRVCVCLCMWLYVCGCQSDS
jgi:hypothetical protein